jgi:hypothetical protein
MPQHEGQKSTEREAMEIVQAEERARGWTPGPPLSQRDQPIEGCDFFSTPPDSGDAVAIEVKGWGEPLLRPNGSFSYPADVRVEQYERARRDPHWRLEIVANLTAVRKGHGQAERLTLTAADVRELATPSLYRIPLDRFAGDIRLVSSGG